MTFDWDMLRLPLLIIGANIWTYLQMKHEEREAARHAQYYYEVVTQPEWERAVYWRPLNQEHQRRAQSLEKSQ